MIIPYGADIQARSKRGWTALMVAAAGGHTEITQLFLERGASTKPATKRVDRAQGCTSIREV